jgi:hypothetical protein
MRELERLEKMTSKQRLRCAFERRQPERLPITNHHCVY